MNIRDAMKILTRLEEKYGNIEVFFDCPFCNKSYKPDEVTTAAIHFTDESKKE